jgi:hypothetical protein
MLHDQCKEGADPNVAIFPRKVTEKRKLNPVV